jgi:hypothetical protein
MPESDLSKAQPVGFRSKRTQSVSGKDASLD